MLLKAILLPLSAILAVAASMPTGADATIIERGELKTESGEAIDLSDENEIIDITNWVIPSDEGVSKREDPQLFSRELGSITCGNGNTGSPVKFIEWFRASKNREICMANGQTRIWRDGANRFQATNRSGSVRCNKFGAFEVNVQQLSNYRRVCNKSCWGRDHVFPGQTFSLYRV